jgi:hypothetical protein
MEKSSSPSRPSIKKVESKKITIDGEDIVVMTLTGKYFKAKTKIKLGNVKAFSTTKKTSKRLIAKFKLEKLESIGQDTLTLRASNSHGKSKAFKDKITLSEIK